MAFTLHRFLWDLLFVRLIKWPCVGSVCTLISGPICSQAATAALQLRFLTYWGRACWNPQTASMSLYIYIFTHALYCRFEPLRLKKKTKRFDLQYHSDGRQLDRFPNLTSGEFVNPGQICFVDLTDTCKHIPWGAQWEVCRTVDPAAMSTSRTWNKWQELAKQRNPVWV